MRSATRVFLALAIGAVTWLGAVDPAGREMLSVGRAHAQDAWRKEFENVCSKTQDAMALTTDELRSLVARCDKLKPAIDGLEESQRKVYSRRLRACRELYAFVVQSREKT